MDRLVPGSKNEIRELQDMVRKLQLQNEELRSQNLKNGFVDNIQASSLESNANRTDPLDVDDAYCTVDVAKVDFSDDERWLCALPNSSKTPSVDIMKWARQDTDANVDFQLAKRKFMDKIEIEQSVRRNIDSRTFTRPKKRVCRPTLGTMVESPLLEESKFPSMQASWHLTESMMIGETLDDISNPLNSGSFSFIDLESFRLHGSMSQHAEAVDGGAARPRSDSKTLRYEELPKHSPAVPAVAQRTGDVEHPAHCDTLVKQVESPCSNSIRSSNVACQRDLSNPVHQLGVMNHTFQKMASEPHLHETSDTRLDFPLGRHSDANTTFTRRAANINVNNTFLKTSDPTLDATQGKAVDVNSAFLLNSRSRSLTPSGLNSTFVVQDVASDCGPRSVRAVSADSGADDDQMSSASDSSFSSGNRLLNVCDVQNIARMQEESLRQVMSTPFQGRGREALGSSMAESLPSPIQLRNPGQEANHDAHYHSDHSDSSSLDSPFGSTQVLASEVRESSQHKERRLVPPVRNDYRRTEVPTARGGAGVAGCLRPPAVSARGSVRPVVSGLPRPAGTRMLSNIPRMQSRIPGPSTIRPARSTQSLRPPVKNAWMDGCY